MRRSIHVDVAAERCRERPLKKGLMYFIRHSTNILVNLLRWRLVRRLRRLPTERQGGAVPDAATKKSKFNEAIRNNQNEAKRSYRDD